MKQKKTAKKTTRTPRKTRGSQTSLGRLHKRLQEIKMTADHELGLGELMIRSGLIDRDRLAEAMGYVTHDRHLATVVIEMGFTTEEDLLKIIDEYYNMDLTAIDATTEKAIKTRPRTIVERLFHIRLPILLKLSVAVAGILALTIFVISYVNLRHQKKQLYEQTVRTGMVSLSYFAGNAKIPLLDDDLLKLNMLIKEASSVEGLLYAIVLDRHGIIKAHSDTSWIGQRYRESLFSDQIEREAGTPFFTYADKQGRKILNLSGPVEFDNVRLGEIHVGVSLDFIEHQIAEETTFILYLSLILILVAIGIAVILGMGFSRPIVKLAEGSRQIGEGNLQYRVNIVRSDELGDLATAFNSMASDLYKKSMMEKSFGSYVSPEVLELILDNPENPWVKGTRSEATVLFTDMRGFTAFSEATEPELVVESLNKYFTIGTEAILEYGGYIDKFIGDAILGVFGVPISYHDHAMRAVKASFYMQHALKEAAVKQGNELLAKIGIGINSGVLVSGNIGSQKKMEYTVIGDTVNVASRLNGLAGAGEVVLSEEVKKRLDKSIILRKMKPATVKGKTEPIQIYRVIDIKDGDQEG
jgi:adenylate cyclase